MSTISPISYITSFFLSLVSLPKATIKFTHDIGGPTPLGKATRTCCEIKSLEFTL
jgi:hypothetical protein